MTKGALTRPPRRFGGRGRVPHGRLKGLSFASNDVRDDAGGGGERELTRNPYGLGGLRARSQRLVQGLLHVFDHASDDISRRTLGGMTSVEELSTDVITRACILFWWASSTRAMLVQMASADGYWGREEHRLSVRALLTGIEHRLDHCTHRLCRGESGRAAIGDCKWVEDAPSDEKSLGRAAVELGIIHLPNENEADEGSGNIEALWTRAYLRFRVLLFGFLGHAGAEGTGFGRGRGQYHSPFPDVRFRTSHSRDRKPTGRAGARATPSVSMLTIPVAEEGSCRSLKFADFKALRPSPTLLPPLARAQIGVFDEGACRVREKLLRRDVGGNSKAGGARGNWRYTESRRELKTHMLRLVMSKTGLDQTTQEMRSVRSAQKNERDRKKTRWRSHQAPARNQLMNSRFEAENGSLRTEIASKSLLKPILSKFRPCHGPQGGPSNVESVFWMSHVTRAVELSEMRSPMVQHTFPHSEPRAFYHVQTLSEPGRPPGRGLPAQCARNFTVLKQDNIPHVRDALKEPSSFEDNTRSNYSDTITLVISQSHTSVQSQGAPAARSKRAALTSSRPTKLIPSPFNASINRSIASRRDPRPNSRIFVSSFRPTRRSSAPSSAPSANSAHSRSTASGAARGGGMAGEADRELACAREGPAAEAVARDGAAIRRAGERWRREVCWLRCGSTHLKWRRTFFTTRRWVLTGMCWDVASVAIVVGESGWDQNAFQCTELRYLTYLIARVAQDTP
ncbi:uncharacterized protein BXZ73DRAFT_79582 [Epithele typhae]|uniref:uncharacterized protein n=1 Tax=Epithele typhae TaxID=378194 RepID=UPI002007C7D2|nr:uncharacterized protein BXZ73DRAFT_79582 [Epithele typhae]KAH9923174.1 hypothetical protein BXZ73DRAFT_79582 [Epithele typhae]